MTKHIDFLYQDEECGEKFFVELSYDPETVSNPETALAAEANIIALENFEEPEFLGVYSKEDAELLGYDTY
jgi:hypothetical protein